MIRKPSRARGMRVFVLIVGSASVASLAAFLRNAAQDAAEYGLWFVLSSVLVGLLVSLALLVLIFGHVRRTTERRGTELLSQMPAAVLLGRVVYAADTEQAVRQLGGAPSSNPGTEHFVAAVDSQELRVVRGKTGTHVLRVPSKDLQSVRNQTSKMLAGGPQATMVFTVRGSQGQTLELPLYLVTSDGFLPRALSADELVSRTALANRVAGLPVDG